MSIGVVQNIENLVSEQIETAKEINLLAVKQFEAIMGNGEFSADEVSRMAALHSSIEVYETEKAAIMSKMGITMGDLRGLSPQLSLLLLQLKDEVMIMREGLARNVKLLDVQITKTKSLIDTVRRAVGDIEEPAEYNGKGRVSRGRRGGFLGAG